jgi:GTPase
MKTIITAVVGASNAGKSTLVNYIVGTKVAIVTPKVQTTRQRIMGIANEDDVQMIFVDTPGVFTPKKEIDKVMVAEAFSSLKDSDYTILLVDAKRFANTGFDDEHISKIIRRLGERNIPATLVLNKVDIMDKARLIEVAAKLSSLYAFDKVFMISARNGSGVKDVIKHLKSLSKPEPWLFPEDAVTNQKDEKFYSEITREKAMLALDGELPYMVEVETEKAEEIDGKLVIHQAIYVKTDAHKKIVIGDNASMIKAIGTASRKELKYFLNRQVQLFLFVKQDKDWLKLLEKLKNS